MPLVQKKGFLEKMCHSKKNSKWAGLNRIVTKELNTYRSSQQSSPAHVYEYPQFTMKRPQRDPLMVALIMNKRTVQLELDKETLATVIEYGAIQKSINIQWEARAKVLRIYTGEKIPVLSSAEVRCKLWY